jgi:cytidine deaminase
VSTDRTSSEEQAANLAVSTPSEKKGGTQSPTAKDSDVSAVDISDDRIKDALHAANEARNRAYAPYSKFKMGAAVVTSSGAVFSGALVENVSLGLAMCAERVALFSSAISQAGRPQVLALSAPRTGNNATWPCGACLQVARELAGPELLIVVDNDGEIHSAKLHELAPRLPAK